MKRYLLKVSGLAILALLLGTAGFSQDNVLEDKNGDTTHDYDEIIIRHKVGKDAKVTVEVKDGKVLVNGKPMSEFKDDDLSVEKGEGGKTGDITIIDGEGIHHEIPFASPFRNYSGSWDFDGNSITGNRAFLGVTSAKPDSGPEGAKVGEISKGSAAEKAGIRTGDLITKLDDTKIDGPESLALSVHEYQPGDKVTITFLRDGKEQKVTATLDKGKKRDNEVYSFSLPPGGQNFNLDGNNFKFGMPPGAFSYSYGNNHRLGIHAQDTEDGKGVKVLDVDDESAAAKAGIKEGDIITTFAGREVNSATVLAQLARETREKPAIPVTLLRDGKTMEVVLKTPRKLNTADL
jgi:serine protease Do